MNKQTLNVYRYCINKGLIYDGIKLIVGVSGGADSVCLLRMLKEMEEVISLSLTAVHFEHGIRGEESLRDMEFVRELCEEYNIPLKLYRENVPAKAKELSMTIEEAGRYLRYEAFDKELKEEGADAIAVAHHLNDQAETVLFNMARGSGIKGISGISPSRGRIIRPLLSVSRTCIEAYLNDIGQTYCVDSTNFDTTYSRNGIRAVVVPELERIVNGAAEHIACVADELREADEYIGMAADRVYGEAVQNGRLLIEVLYNEPAIIRRYVVRKLLADIYTTHKDLEAVHVEEVLSLCDKQSGRSVSLPKGITARREGDAILFFDQGSGNKDGTAGSAPSKAQADILKKQLETKTVYIKPELNGITRIQGYGEFGLSIEEYDKTAEIPKEPYTKWFDYDKIVCGVLIRNRQDGDFITVDSDGHRKKLKKYLIDEKIPLSERNGLIMLADGAHIIWVIGHRISTGYKVDANTVRVLKVTFRPFV